MNQGSSVFFLINVLGFAHWLIGLLRDLAENLTIFRVTLFDESRCRE
jgi:hypothetical protein